MKVTRAFRVALLASATLSILAGRLLSQNKTTGSQCTAVAISFSLKMGDSFERQINYLSFKVQPMDSSGWGFSLQGPKDDDFFYPVNPPLRLNASQTLGAGYGDTAKQSLSHGRELLFLLNESDYAALWPLVENALWPSSDSNPGSAADQYFTALDKLRTGQFRLTIVRSDISENDEVRSAEFRVEFIAPTAFHFASSLAPNAAACPEASLPINERLRVRVPPADRRKFRNVRDAANWDNPYLVITTEGFDLRFHGGQSYGPLSILAHTVVGLPDSAWPYGRVIAASESGIRRTDGGELIKSNKEKADKILRELGVTVDWGPSA
jgi:hypothetical protein